jgi:hypothetical protein
MFDRYEDFARVMDKCTENHSAIVMDNTTGSCNVDECIFWYKASYDLPEFKIGKPVFWNLSKQYQKTQEQQRKEDFERKQLEKFDNLPKANKRISHVACEDEEGNLIGGRREELLI